MSDWIEKPLAQLISPLETGKRPAGGVSAETEGVPSLGGENIDADGKMSYSNVNRILLAYARLLKKGKVKSGDTLINKDGAQTGKVAQYDGRFADAWINEHVFIVRADPNKIDAGYLFYSILDGRAQNQIARRITGSAQPGLNSDFAKAVTLRLPRDINLQAKIAGILQLLDVQIEATEALIAKQEQVRTGLMQDLFTRGVDEHGQLRPPHQEAPQFYHQTQLGWLPKEWDTSSILRYCTESRQAILTGPFGADLGSADFVDDGVPLLRIGNVQDRHLRLDDLLFVSEGKALQLAKYRITPNDLLFARQGATTGRNALASQEVDGALINYHIIRVSLDPTKCNPRFVESMFNSWLITHQIERSKGRGTREGINTQQITSLRFPGPMVAEQNRITAILNEAMAAIEAMKGEIAKLRLQKEGMMQDLLTGKVSVTPLLGAVAA
ncbi:restriction endonuclease subunit S [Bradyrhizobium sp. SEMIA]|uniref:restriction endonuclease subunit S n=1 Tax=Bradyrhizobium sp. SEMIA TaxID=2597515 RepID=UPI0018A61257|nr:restriction endonuclease subunit S [Bradyrhizobium sp. SEMIA]QOG17597.1 hypothetical protein FOM02_09850 [Bradyrhizobium sp. SEMIA]